MAVFFKINPRPRAGCAHFDSHRKLGNEMLHGIRYGNDAQVLADGLIIIGAGLDAGNLGEQSFLYAGLRKLGRIRKG